MSTDENPRDKLFKTNDGVRDTVASTISAVSSAVGAGFVGDVLGNLVSTVMGGRSTSEKMQWFATEVEAEFSRLDMRIDEIRDEMKEYFVRLMQEAVPIVDKAKLKMLRNAIVNTVLGTVEDAWMSPLLECVRDLSVHEMQLMNVFYFGHDEDMRVAQSLSGQKVTPPRRHLRGAVDALGHSRELLTVMVARLERLKLVDTQTTTDDAGIHELLSARKTSLGLQLFKFINAPDATVPIEKKP